MFPEMFDSFARSVLVERAEERDLLELEIIDIKDYAGGSYRHIDDSPFGGGAGMVIRCAPVIEALETIGNENSHTVMFAPSGTPYTQAKVHEFEKKEHIIEIEDNGVGFDTAILDDVNFKNHVGIKNTDERLRLMCKGSMLVESEPGKGTRVTIIIPKD